MVTAYKSITDEDVLSAVGFRNTKQVRGVSTHQVHR